MKPKSCLALVGRVIGVDSSEITGRSKHTRIILARQLVVYLLRTDQQHDYTLECIGELLGHRSPATISHAFKRLAQRRLLDSNLSATIDILSTQWGSNG